MLKEKFITLKMFFEERLKKQTNIHLKREKNHQIKPKES